MQGRMAAMAATRSMGVVHADSKAKTVIVLTTRLYPRLRVNNPFSNYTATISKPL